MKKRFNTLSRRVFIGSLFGVAAAVLVSSCKKDNGYEFDGAVTAKVQLVNANPDAGPAQLFIQNVLRTPNTVSYGNVSGYNDSYTGQQDFSIQSPSGTVLASGSAQVDAANYYSFILAGSSSNTSVITVKDDQTAPSSGNARVRFVQASADAPVSNVTANGTGLFTALNYKGVSAYAEVTAGTYIFRLVNASTSTVLATGSSITLAAGKIYTIYSKGSVSGSGSSALSISAITVN
ncbi:uncharacterized protein DUF4397 [Mucilaginibacter yixingensis]|uniref:Uncharacterized protein DUF4397 n=1 Tax=Mucilaginibacter yixingensis TaxID=1295612 RepID=A0A2T5J814_9SPHI|nr:DUF4397 domain-containing protein [Mucilaginibacter yixingensis]PTQ95607.1 uncharacterized protein DUF4397 [Mucilaginibacter yixingensis]